MATNVGVGILHCVNETIGGLLSRLAQIVGNDLVDIVIGQLACDGWESAFETLFSPVTPGDRGLMVVILASLKQEFGMTDAQLGLLSGFSYAAAFALAGIPSQPPSSRPAAPPWR
jgi:hypothetical protein